jgi:hypothetical protein
MNITQAELKIKLDLHLKWLHGETGGERADLRSADLSYADLPSPTMLLLASWYQVSAKLTLKLMRYDAANHPEPTKFDEWAKGGDCPYADVKWQRCATFQENRELWKPGKATKSALELVLMLFKEKEIKR